MKHRGRNKEIERHRLNAEKIEELLKNPSPKTEEAEDVDQDPVELAIDIVTEMKKIDNDLEETIEIENGTEINTETEGSITPPPKPTYHNDEAYDSMRPEEHIREFVDYIRRCIRQYEWDEEQLEICDHQTQDLLHYMEMTAKKKRQDGYNLYTELMKVRRERRKCKNEMEILAPVCQLFRNTKVLDQMTKVQGECRIVRESIDQRLYSARTDILDKFEG